MSADATADVPVRWWVVMPVKGGASAKSRLVAPRGARRGALARALALDTVVAAAEAVGADRVFVVTASRSVGKELAASGVTVLPDPGGGLNAAARAGLEGIPAQADGRAVLLADLPAARAEDIRSALTEAAQHPRAMVPDHAGEGTVLVTVRRPLPLLPAFGAGSAQGHTELGHHPVGLHLARLRLDVDTRADLAAAVALGVGQRTAAALALARG